MDEIVQAWAEIHDATPAGWVVGRPGYNDNCRQWEQYAYDPRETPKAGKRSREWTAIAPTALGVVEEWRAVRGRSARDECGCR